MSHDAKTLSTFHALLKPVRLLGVGHESIVIQCSTSSGGSIREKSVVVKFIRDEEEAKSEIETLIRMWHPNVINLIDTVVASWGNEWFGIVMHEMEMDLRTFTENELYGASITAEIARQSAGGLHHVHQFGTLHADIKQENIGVSVSRNKENNNMVENVHVRLIDFGSARLVSSIRNGETIRSTRSCQSPEKRVGVFHYPGDIYELGVVFQEVLSCSIDGNTTTTEASSIDNNNNNDMFNALISDMMMLDFNLRPTSFQLIVRLQDPYHDLQKRLLLLSLSSSNDLILASSDNVMIRLNEELSYLIQCGDPLDFLPRDFGSRIEFITRNAASDDVRSVEWYLFLFFKTSQQITADMNRDYHDDDNRAVFYGLIHHHFNSSSNASWLTKLLYCMVIDTVSKLNYCFMSLDESIVRNLCDYSTIVVCESRIRNTLSRCLSGDLFQLCSSMSEWGVDRVEFESFLNQEEVEEEEDIMYDDGDYAG